MSSPKFVYAHIVVPHTPFVFSPSGEYLADGHRNYSDKKRYSDQVYFIDSQIVSISRQIIKNSTNPPIIIIQGDHGVPLEYIKSGGTGQKPGILNAYYFPDGNDMENLYPTISPVNTFRLIFNLYFGANLDILPDKVYRENDAESQGRRDFGSPYNFQEYIISDGCAGEK